MLNCTNLANDSAVSIQSTLMDLVPLMCSVTKQQTVEVECSKRIDGSVAFHRDWAEYKSGFGNLNGEFWLGLHKIYRFSNSERYQLRVDLEDIEGKTVYAVYDMFAACYKFYRDVLVYLFDP